MKNGSEHIRIRITKCNRSQSSNSETLCLFDPLFFAVRPDTLSDILAFSAAVNTQALPLISDLQNRLKRRFSHIHQDGNIYPIFDVQIFTTGGSFRLQTGAPLLMGEAILGGEVL